MLAFTEVHSQEIDKFVLRDNLSRIRFSKQLDFPLTILKGFIGDVYTVFKLLSKQLYAEKYTVGVG